MNHEEPLISIAVSIVTVALIVAVILADAIGAAYEAGAL